MHTLLFDPVDRDNLQSLPLEAGDPPADVISGAPLAAEHVLHVTDAIEIGVWEITPSTFRSKKLGVSEFMYFLSGSGTITRENGEVVSITPGAYVSLPDGSRVVWDVTETVRKVYIITTTQA